MIKQRSVEFRIGTDRSGKLVEVEPKLPAPPIRTPAKTLHKARRRRVQ
jgi:hypothetical protein